MFDQRASASTSALVPDAGTVCWRGMVIYQIYPRSFMDSNGDGVGDLPGIKSKLDYIAALGVDAVWISPFFTSPMKDFGYDVADFCGVDPQFGTLDDFDALVAEAHRLGLKVIIDQVYSHTSDQHPWFRESRQNRTGPKADWYVWADPKPDGSPPNNWQSVFAGAAWSWDTMREQYYLHNFLREQPDLNFHNPDVQNAILDVARFWLERSVDGFRLDAVNFYMHDRTLTDNPALGLRLGAKPFDMQVHIHNQSQPEIPLFLERFRALIDGHPDAFTIAEIGGDNALAEMKQYTQYGRRLHTSYSFVFLEAPHLTARVVREAVSPWALEEKKEWPSFTFSNHDRPRAVSRWARDQAEEENPAFARFLNMLLLSLKGSICLYQGEELGLPQAEVPYESLKDPEAIANWPETLGRDGTRTPMPWQAQDAQGGFTSGSPWLPMPDRHRQLAVSEQEGDRQSCLEFTREFLAFRKRQAALVRGGIRFLDSAEPLLVFERFWQGDRLLCVFNTGAAAAECSAVPEGSELLFAHGLEKGDWAAGRCYRLAPHTGLIWRLGG